MNILLLAQASFPDTGSGGGRYIYELARVLQRQGHRIVVFVPQDPGSLREETIQDVRVVRYGSFQRWWHLPGSLVSIHRLFNKLHREFSFDVLSIHQPLPAVGLMLNRHARRLSWVYHFHSPWAEEWRLRRAPQRAGPHRWMSIWARGAIEHRVVRRSIHRITLSESMKAMLVATHRLQDDSVTVIPGAVDLKQFHVIDSPQARRRDLGLPHDRQILLTVRNLERRMNLDGLIKAMQLIVARRPNTLLLIGGSGPMAKRLGTLIHRLNLTSHVRLLGRIPESTLPHWYQAADVFLMPSKALEGFGLATLEALACGTPVAGTPIGGTKELLEQLDPSLLSDDISPQAIATVIQNTLQRLDVPAAQQALSRRCRAFASKFSVQSMVQRIESVYQKALRPVVFHLHTLPVISGSGLNTFFSMNGQLDTGFAVEFGCAPGGPLPELVAQQGIVVRPLTHLVRSPHLIHDVLVVWDLWRLMRRARYTIVHTHNSKAGFVGRLAAKLAGIPIVIHTVHGFAFHAYESRWRRWVYRMLERLAARWCDKLIMISQGLVDWALRERIAPQEKIVKIYSGIDLAAFCKQIDPTALRTVFGLQDDEFVVGEIAKLWPGKGHEVLFRAAATLTTQIPNLRLLIVGAGHMRASLERLASKLGISEQVVFTGFRTDIPALTHLLDVAVLPSFFEGMGRAVLEAQAAGKPIIATRVGGIPDLIVDDRTGLLVEPGNVEQLASAIRRLYEDPQLRATLGQAAQQATDEQFSIKTMVEQILWLYDELMTQKLRHDEERESALAQSHG